MAEYPATRDAVRIAPQPGHSKLSAAQKAFNRLTRRIATQRERLEAWRDNLPTYQQALHETYLPLDRDYRRLQAQMVQFLDQQALVAHKSLSKADRATLQEVICDLAGFLIGEYGFDELKPLYERHSGNDFDTELAEDEALLKDALGQLFDLDPEDIAAAADPEELNERIHAEQGSRDDRRRKPGKASARDARKREAEEKSVQSIREIYRKLASALHPDREPDQAERERKTGLMQRANQAYETRDLLTLLELQLETDRIPQSAIDGLAGDRLKQYNALLSRQVAGLEHELRELEDGFRLQFGLDPFEPVEPTRLGQRLRADLRELRDNIAGLKTDLREFRDLRALKCWLKDYRRHSDELDMDEFDTDMFDALAEEPAPRRRR